MKALLISTYFPPDKGGISHLMYSIASELGPDYVCCLTDVKLNDTNKNKHAPFNIYRRPLAFAKSPVAQLMGWSTTIAEIILRERPKVAMLATVNEGYLGVWMKKWLGTPFVIFAHGNEILDILNKDSRIAWDKPRQALRQADGVIAVSRFTADLVKRVGVSPDRIKVVYPGCDFSRFQPIEREQSFRREILGEHWKDRVILTVGNLVERKGHDMVIRSLPKVLSEFPDVTYLIIGQGPYRETLERMAVDLGIKKHVIFAGQISEDKLPDVYAISDLFVMVSRERADLSDVEGFGLVFLEANACEKPVIGGLSGGVPEAIVDEYTGLIVRPDSSDAISASIKKLLADKSLASRLGKQGRSRVINEFNWTVAGNQIRHILSTIYTDRP